MPHLIPRAVKPAVPAYDPRNWIRLLLAVPRRHVFRLLALDVLVAGIYAVVVASMLTFFATMGLERVAGEIENPIGDDANDPPLEQISATIARAVHRILSVRLASSESVTP